MQDLQRKKNKEKIISTLPAGLKNEISAVLRGLKGGIERLCEIRLRAFGRCSLVLDDCTLPLCYLQTADGLWEITSALLGDSLYAYRDALIKGYIPLSYGVRVGVSGTLSYDGGKAVGVSEISSLVFRFPSGECDCAEELAEAFLTYAKSGMLVFSAPGVGKTTALRSLARRLSRGEGALRVAVVDTRLEFIPEDYVGCEIDLLRGYSRPDGIEVALRTLSPQVIIADELGSSDGDCIRRAVGCGVPIIATLHASSLKEAEGRLKEMDIAPAAFDLTVGLSRGIGGRTVRIYPAAEERIPCPSL